MKARHRFIHLHYAGAASALLVAGWTLAALTPGCADDSASIGARSTSAGDGRGAHVLTLGNLRAGAPPSQAQVRLSEFLFGVEPDATPQLIRPADVAATGGDVLICDLALATVFARSESDAGLREAHLADRPGLPVAIEATPGGDRLVCDAANRCVWRFDANGRQLARYEVASDVAGLDRAAPSRGEPGDQREPQGAIHDTASAPVAFKPASSVQVGSEVWVSNAAAHRIERFDAQSGRHIGHIGERGRGPLQFGIPLGMALTPNGDVCVVDMLNSRVQVLGPDGRWLRDIGGPGDRPGQLGRPKDVAVGPDGVIFITDAASQRVHAFHPDGTPLLTFGGPDAGRFALELPAGIAIWQPTREPVDSTGGFKAHYQVLVAEGSALPGVRVFAWRSPWEVSEIEAWRRPGIDMAGAGEPQSVAASPRTVSPHWRADACGDCHTGQPAAMTPQESDPLCLSCHNGERASAEAHPVGRLVAGPNLRVPEWPLNDGRLSCLTCHAISRHCDTAAERPALNPAMLRTFEPNRPFAICSDCHVSEQPWRINPHLQLGEGEHRRPAGANQSVATRANDQTGGGEPGAPPSGAGLRACEPVEYRPDSCLFCHTTTPPIPSDGRRSGEALLRVEGEALCLSCHNRHWDFSPRGHVGRPVTDAVRANLALAAEQSPRAALPLDDGTVTCWSCHNPHQEGLFSPGTPLGAHASNPLDRNVALRMNFNELCFACHRK